MNKQPKDIHKVGGSIQRHCNILIQISSVQQTVIRHSKKQESMTDTQKKKKKG